MDYRPSLISIKTSIYTPRNKSKYFKHIYDSNINNIFPVEIIDKVCHYLEYEMIALFFTTHFNIYDIYTMRMISSVQLNLYKM